MRASLLLGHGARRRPVTCHTGVSPDTATGARPSPDGATSDTVSIGILVSSVALDIGEGCRVDGAVRCPASPGHARYSCRILNQKGTRYRAPRTYHGMVGLVVEAGEHIGILARSNNWRGLCA